MAKVLRSISYLSACLFASSITTCHTMRWLTYVLVPLVAKLTAAEDSSLAAALSADDQCVDDADSCALHALQRRSRRQPETGATLEAAPTKAGSTESSTMDKAALKKVSLIGGCNHYGCVDFVPGRDCQCDPACTKHGNCCEDRAAVCILELENSQVHKQNASVNAALLVSGCASRFPMTYTKNWESSGQTFFDDWSFMSVEETHGATQYLQKEQALAEGIISTVGGKAIIRTGGLGDQNKRKSVNLHSNYAWPTEKSWLLVLKYDHLPYGPGVWPGFWTMNSDQVWPLGGELDILEYANDEANKVSFHTNKDCYLDQAKLYSCVHGGGVSDTGPLNCNTNYFANLMGCRPQQRRHNGLYFSSRPGVIATEWTPEHIKVFHIPQDELPDDLQSNSPRPDGWDRWIMAYLPFSNTAACRDIALPQEIVLSLALCGDWAGNAWERCPTCLLTGMNSNAGTCQTNIWDPANDCCTKFVTSAAAEQALSTAYFSIDYVKVFVPEGYPLGGVLSGTKLRGGVPFTAPAKAS